MRQLPDQFVLFLLPRVADRGNCVWQNSVPAEVSDLRYNFPRCSGGAERLDTARRLQCR